MTFRDIANGRLSLCRYKRGAMLLYSEKSYEKMPAHHFLRRHSLYGGYYLMLHHGVSQNHLKDSMAQSYRKAFYFSPKIAFKIVFPIFLSIPALLIGTPVVREIFCFTCVIPKACFHEKERPGIGVDFFCAIVLIVSKIRRDG